MKLKKPYIEWSIHRFDYKQWNGPVYGVVHIVTARLGRILAYCQKHYTPATGEHNTQKRARALARHLGLKIAPGIQFNRGNRTNYQVPQQKNGMLHFESTQTKVPWALRLYELYNTIGLPEFDDLDPTRQTRRENPSKHG